MLHQSNEGSISPSKLQGNTVGEIGSTDLRGILEPEDGKAAILEQLRRHDIPVLGTCTSSSG
jgi:hypothetical protein